MDKFDLVKEKIDSITKNAPIELEYSHSQSVLNWVLKLKPDANFSLKVAALGHDIDRSLPERRARADDYTNYDMYKKEHSKISAEIVAEIMREVNCEENEIEGTRKLIENHEVGGEGDVEILKEADSLSFFENNLEDYKKRYPDFVEEKIEFMYNRLSDEGKKIAREILSRN